MRKNINFINILILCLIPCILDAQSLMESSQQKNKNRSVQLIERYNKLRSSRSLSIINRDSVIDDVTNEILLDKKYRKSTSEFNEDSIRSLFYDKGVMDYKFEIKEISDKDTSVTFNTFLLADTSANIRIGYSKYGNKHLLIKTKSYLKYDFGVFACSSSIKNDEHHPNLNQKVQQTKIDTAIFYVKAIIPGKYFYHYLNHIPLSLEPMMSDKKYEVKESLIKNPFTKETTIAYHGLVLTSCRPDMYLIVTNDKDEIIAILK